MHKRSWLQEPQRITEINATPILPTTLKALKMIAADYQKKGMRPAWRTTYFQNLIVVARLLETGSRLVLSDNTDVLIHEAAKHPIGPELLLRNQYYRFVFEITPYTSDSLAILKIQWISPSEIVAHLSEVVGQELIGQLHMKLLKELNENQKQVKINSNSKKEQILNVIAHRSRFTVEDIEREVDCDGEVLTQIIEELLGDGKIGDLGSCFIVIEYGGE